MPTNRKTKSIGQTNSPYYILLALLIPLFIAVLTIKERVIGTHNSIIVLSAISVALFTLPAVKDKTVRFPSPFTTLFILLLTWMFLAGSYSKNIGDSIWEILRMVSFFMLFIAVYNLAKKDQRVQNLVVNSFLIISVALLIKDFFAFVASGELVSGRYLTGTFYWHNQMAGFLLFLIPILLAILLKTKHPVGKFILLLTNVFVLLLLILTYSRGGWISLSVALLLFVLLAFKSIRAHLKILLVMAGIVVFLTPIFVKTSATLSQYSQSIQEEISPETRSVSGNLRTTVWENSVKMIENSPVFGIGPGAFGSVYYNYQTTPWLYAKNAHNYFLEIAAENGLPGFTIFTLLIFMTAYIFWLRKNEIVSSENNLLVTGIATALFATILHSLLDVDWSRITLFSLFWIFLAILLAKINKKESVIEISGFKNFIHLLPLIIIIASTLLLVSERNYQLAQASIYGNNFSKGEEYITKSLAVNPFDERFFLTLGAIKENQKDMENAKKQYQKAINLYPLNSETYYRLGTIKLQGKHYQEAENLFKKAVETNPYSHPKLYIALADTYIELNQPQLAQDALEKTIYQAFPLDESFKGFEYLYNYTGLKKDLAQAYIRLISLDIRLNRKVEAQKLLDVVENFLDPSNPLIPLLKTEIQK